MRPAIGVLILVLSCGLCGALALAQEAAHAGDDSAVGTPVAEIRLVPEDGQAPRETLPKNLPVQVGKPLNEQDVAESLRILYQTGDYANLRAVVFFVANGVRLDFITKQNLFVNQVIVNGLKAPPTEASAVAATQLLLGATYRPSDVDDGMARLQDLLRDEGLYNAKIEAKNVVHPGTRQIDIIANVNPGERVRLSRIELNNNTEYRNDDLIKLAKLKVGEELTIAKVQNAVERVRKFLEKKGHLSARVSARRGEYESSSNTLPLAIEVSEGPRVQVQVEGAKFSKTDLRKLIPVYQEGSVDVDLLEEGKRNLQERMEREGYFDASVTYSTAVADIVGPKTGWKGSQETITYKVDRGERHKLLKIEFSGNRYFSKSVLASRLTIAKGSWTTRAKFSRRLLDNDALSMRNLYVANGFLNAKVEGKVNDDVEGKKGDLVIDFVITEGEQTLVASLVIEGAKAISEKEVLSVVGSSPGQPYSDINVASDRDNILALYFNEGFPNATFTFTAEPQPAPAEAAAENAKVPNATVEHPSETAEQRIQRSRPMRLVYKIDEGSQFRVRDVLLTGYVHTKRSVIERYVGLQKDSPLREGDVVATQQKLYNLGIFNRVTVEPQNANGTDPDKDVVVLVEEAKRYTIAYGGGFEVQRLASTTNPTGGEVQAAPRGILEISKQNLTGRADSLSLKLRGSTIQGRALLAYNQPNSFASSHLSTQITAYAEKTQDINTFSQDRYEANIQITDQITPRSSFLARYAFRKVTVSNLNIPADEVPLFNQPTLVSEFSATYFRDTRDNPADASKGMFTSADLAVSSTAIGSSASFLRLFVQSSGYTRIAKNWTYARSIRLGMLMPFADTVSLTFPAQTTTPPPQVIPLPERFFAGGGTSLRSFALNQAGPRDSITGFPVGGQAVLVINQEIRFPLKVPYVPSGLGGAFFYDGGNVYSQVDRITFRWQPPKPVLEPAYPDKDPGRFNPEHCVYNCTNELNFFSHTIGFGLRYATPIGPIRVDLGYQLNPAYFVIPCKDHAPFCQQETRLNRVQVFFNLGSSF